MVAVLYRLLHERATVIIENERYQTIFYRFFLPKFKQYAVEDGRRRPQCRHLANWTKHTRRR